MMTPQELQSLGERVAKALGWKRIHTNSGDHSYFWDGSQTHVNPSDPAEAFKLAAEFQIDFEWVERSDGNYGLVGCAEVKSICTYLHVPHDNTPSGRLNAAIEAILLAVLAIKEKQG